MPDNITTIPATRTTTTAEPIECNAYSIDDFHANGRLRDKGPWDVTIVACPYVIGDPAADPPVDNIYASETETYHTKDAATAAANMAAVGLTVPAIVLLALKNDVALQWRQFRESRRPALIAATAAADAADALAVTKAEGVKQAEDQLTDLLRQLTEADPGAAMRISGNMTEQVQALFDAYRSTEAAVAVARQDAADADAAAKLANDRKAVAQAAVDDPANPALTD
ncbi:MAG: hypothetical protein QM754_00645 [Tepidisphaeraceae bacterium]